MNAIIFVSFFLFFTAVNLFFKSEKGKQLFQTDRNFLYIGIAIVAVQILSAALYKQQIIDVFLFSDAGHYLRQKIDYYWIDSAHDKYPFFPFLIFHFAILDWVTEVIPKLNFMFLIKLSLVPALIVLASWVKKKSANIQIGKTQFLDLLTSPITYAIIYFHGQIDVILIAFFVLSMEYWQKDFSNVNSKLTMKTTLMSALFYAASVASKTWSILFAPIIFWYHKKSTYLYLFFASTAVLLFANIFGYTRYVFGSSIRTVLPALIKPGGQLGNWGITLVPQFLPFITENKLAVYAALICLGYVLLLRKKLEFWQAITLFILWLYIVAIHWAVQYLFWALPFIIMNKKWLGEKWSNLFLSLSTIYVFMVYVDISSLREIFVKDFVNFFGIFLWLLVVYKFCNKLQKNKSD